MKEKVMYVNGIINIANCIKRNQIDLESVPFEDFLTFIYQFYEQYQNKGGFFCEAYCAILTNAIERQDAEEISEILAILANQILLLINETMRSDSAEYATYMEKKYRTCEVEHQKHLRRQDAWYNTHSVSERTPFEGKGVVYTAITGNYDDVKEPEYMNPNLDYILFTNNRSITSSKWKVVYIDNPEGLDNVRLARRVKILGHEYLAEYDYSIWVDAKLEIKDDMREYVEKYRKREPMLCFVHYLQNCIYQELLACEALKKDDVTIMEKQIAGYRKAGYPENNGLIESGILVRDIHNQKVKQLMEAWWHEILCGSRRDQLSFNYVCWKNDFMYDTSELFIYGNKYVKLYSHN